MTTIKKVSEHMEYLMLEYGIEVLLDLNSELKRRAKKYEEQGNDEWFRCTWSAIHLIGEHIDAIEEGYPDGII